MFYHINTFNCRFMFYLNCLKSEMIDYGCLFYYNNCYLCIVVVYVKIYDNCNKTFKFYFKQENYLSEMKHYWYCKQHLLDFSLIHTILRYPKIEAGCYTKSK